jgi:hypothetical protein
MANKAQELIDKDIAARLSKIAFHFEERDSLNTNLRCFTVHDCDPAAPTNSDLRRTITRIQTEELSTLYELVHLMDNVTKHYDAYGLAKSELTVVGQFRPFRAAANYVNTHKHGTRGRNKASAKLDYHALIFERTSKMSNPAGKIVGVCSIINFDGKLLQAMDVVESLIRIWELFLRHHTEIDLKPFTDRIAAVFKKHHGLWTFAHYAALSRA